MGFRGLLSRVVFVTGMVLSLQSTWAKDYEEIEWIALMPEDDLQALLNPPEYIAGIADGSEEDSIGALEGLEGDEYSQFSKALKSTRVVETYVDRTIRVPGFIVPLDNDENQKVTEFFVVPYFGACLHMPPPPPNQMIHVKFEQGVELANLYDPFWFEGTLKQHINTNDLGTSAYALEVDNVIPYTE